MRHTNPFIPFAILFVLVLSSGTLYSQDDVCECTNCPLDVVDYGSFDGELAVQVDGPNDLEDCPILEVCFTITHTWVGDLSVSLTSPSGLNYLLMADLDNDVGCGTNGDNVNVCFQAGTGSPLTNNTEYICGGGPTCLAGDFTLACGGVTDPFSGALQAPNCDLDDFNIAGDPVNGTWVLTVNDICALDIGELNNWSIKFGCDVEICMSCEPQVTNQTQNLCTGDCITIDGVEYCPPGIFPILYMDQFGCDSTVMLELVEVPINSEIADADTITCFQMNVTLDGSASSGDNFEWTDETGMVLGTDPTLNVSEGGCYTLISNSEFNGVECADTTEMCVIELLILPDMPTMTGNVEVCDGDVEFYNIDPDPQADDYVWTFPSDALLLSGGNGDTQLELDWSSSVGGQVCVSALNPCGPGVETCLEVIVLTVPANPILNGPEMSCKTEPPFIISTPEDSNITDYSWTVPLDATVVSGGDSNELEVQWGEDETGEICLTVFNICGESESTCITVNEACDNRDIPNAFSPNGDGVNDRFKVIKGSGVTVNSFQVFDRWGQMVYDNEAGDAGWDGNFDGKPMPEDVFAYLIQMTLSTGEVVIAEGEVTLIR